MKAFAIPVEELPRYVTPYLPDDAISDIRRWQMSGHRVFHRVMPQTQEIDACPNCSGIGLIYISYCDAGPFKNVPNGLATYYDGPFGEGWYTIKSTVSYRCPHCLEVRAKKVEDDDDE